MNERELTELCGKVRDDSITGSEAARLEQHLRDDPVARDFYLRFLQLDAMLERFAPVAEDTTPFLPANRRLATLALATAAAVALVSGGWFLRTPAEAPTAPGRTTVATLLFAEDCEWVGKGPQEGQGLAAGAIELIRGTAAIRFDGGAEAVLSGPVALKISGPASAALHHGEVVVRAEDGAEGFRLSTPRGELIDLGTEFAVKVAVGGETELHVHEGEVAVGDDFESKPENVIEAGGAVKLGLQSEVMDRVQFDAPRFQELLARAGPKERRDLMTVYEGFHVDPGTYAPRELNTGKGWAGPWRPRRPEEAARDIADAATRMKIAHSQMDVAWPIKGGEAGMLEMPTGSSVWIREMKKPVETGKWGIHYFSFLVTEPEVDVARRADGKLERNDLRFTFRSSLDYFGESLSIGWEQEQRPRASSGHGISSRSVRTVPDGSTVFCVAKIVTRKTGDDHVSFRFYTPGDELDLVEPAEWDVVLRGLDLTADLDLLVLTSNSPETRYVDEIRLGPSWRSVTPVDTPLLLTNTFSPTGNAIP